MGLAEVLQQRSGEHLPNREDVERQVGALVDDIKNWVKDFPLDVDEWSVLVQYLDERFSLPSVTIQFKGEQVTVLPRSFIAGRRPQVEVSSGARAALLEYAKGQGWMYSWEGARNPPEPLTKDAFLNVVVAGLLR